MHREHAVENLWRNEMVMRNDELYAHDRRFDAADDEHQKRVEDVKNPELLVIDGDNPIVQPLADRSCVGVRYPKRDGV